jgi:general secretion pathway protein M
MSKVSMLLAPYRARFEDWWQNLAKRERAFLRTMLIVIGIALLYFVIYQPINKTIAELQQAVNYQNTIVQSIKPKVAEIQSFKHSTAQANQVNANNLLSVVDQNLKQQQLDRYTSEVSQTSSNGVQIKFSNISFDQLLQWLIALWQRYQIQVSQIEVKPTKTIGNVEVLLIVRNG